MHNKPLKYINIFFTILAAKAVCSTLCHVFLVFVKIINNLFSLLIHLSSQSLLHGNHIILFALNIVRLLIVSVDFLLQHLPSELLHFHNASLIFFPIHFLHDLIVSPHHQLLMQFLFRIVDLRVCLAELMKIPLNLLIQKLVVVLSNLLELHFPLSFLLFLLFLRQFMKSLKLLSSLFELVLFFKILLFTNETLQTT